MFKKILIIMIFFSISINSNIHSQSITWNRTYNLTTSDFAWEIMQTEDEGYVVAGQGQNSWILKVDSLGNQLWNHSSQGFIRSIQQTNDKGFIQAGSVYSNNNNIDFKLTKRNRFGRTLWSKTYGGDDIDDAWSVKQTLDNGFIIVGYTSSFDVEVTDFWIVKTDENGNEEWNKTFGGDSFEYCYSVQQTNDEGFILAGGTKSFGNGHYDFWLIKTDEYGNENWSKTFGGSNGDMALEVQQTNDSGFVLIGQGDYTGDSFSDFKVVKTDENGIQEWCKTYGGVKYDIPYSIKQTNDQGYIITGSTKSFASIGSDIWLLKIDEYGTEEWSRTFGESEYNETATSVIQTNDEGYIIAGSTKEYGQNNNDCWIIKTDEQGITTNIINEPSNYKNYTLSQNYPNPFNPVTRINYTSALRLRSVTSPLSVNQSAKIVIHNSLGQQVWSSPITDHALHVTGSILFDGSKFNSGIYYYSLVVDGEKVSTKSMVLIK